MFTEVEAAVLRAKEAGETVTGDPYNGHWNDRGHAIAGRELMAILSREGLVSERQP